MDLGYPSETVVYYLIISGIICLGCQDDFPIMSVLAHMMSIGLDLR